MTVAVVVGILGLVVTGVMLTAYASNILPFIMAVPEYISTFMQVIIAWIPTYVIMPLVAMMALLVSYLMIHLFSKFMNNMPGG